MEQRISLVNSDKRVCEDGEEVRLPRELYRYSSGIREIYGTGNRRRVEETTEYEVTERNIVTNGQVSRACRQLKLVKSVKFRCHNLIKHSRINGNHRLSRLVLYHLNKLNSVVDLNELLYQFN